MTRCRSGNAPTKIGHRITQVPCSAVHQPRLRNRHGMRAASETGLHQLFRSSAPRRARRAAPDRHRDLGIHPRKPGEPDGTARGRGSTSQAEQRPSAEVARHSRCGFVDGAAVRALRRWGNRKRTREQIARPCVFRSSTAARCEDEPADAGSRGRDRCEYTDCHCMERTRT